MRLFHASEERGIARFEPRIPPNDSGGVSEPVVWAVEQERLYNYLLPRDCPRVSFFASAKTTAEEARRLIGPELRHAVLAIERGWVERLRAALIYLYEV